LRRIHPNNYQTLSDLVKLMEDKYYYYAGALVAIIAVEPVY